MKSEIKKVSLGVNYSAWTEDIEGDGDIELSADYSD